MTTTLTKRVRAREVNPGGISRSEAIRSLRETGYSDGDIAAMIETLGTDSAGAVIWRWRTSESGARRR